jgi:hypothetical protein
MFYFSLSLARSINFISLKTKVKNLIFTKCSTPKYLGLANAKLKGQFCLQMSSRQVKTG